MSFSKILKKLGIALMILTSSASLVPNAAFSNSCAVLFGALSSSSRPVQSLILKEGLSERLKQILSMTESKTKTIEDMIKQDPALRDFVERVSKTNEQWQKILIEDTISDANPFRRFSAQLRVRLVKSQNGEKKIQIQIDELKFPNATNISNNKVDTSGVFAYMHTLTTGVLRWLSKRFSNPLQSSEGHVEALKNDGALFLGVLLKSLEGLTVADPSVSSIQVLGKSYFHPSTRKAMQELGFTSKNMWRSRPWLSLSAFTLAEGVPAYAFFFAPEHTGFVIPALGAIATLGVAAGSAIWGLGKWELNVALNQRVANRASLPEAAFAESLSAIEAALKNRVTDSSGNITNRAEIVATISKALTLEGLKDLIGEESLINQIVDRILESDGSISLREIIDREIEAFSNAP